MYNNKDDRTDYFARGNYAVSIIIGLSLKVNHMHFYMYSYSRCNLSAEKKVCFISGGGGGVEVFHARFKTGTLALGARSLPMYM